MVEEDGRCLRACLRFSQDHRLVEASAAACERGWHKTMPTEDLPIDELRPIADRIPRAGPARGAEAPAIAPPM